MSEHTKRQWAKNYDHATASERLDPRPDEPFPWIAVTALVIIALALIVASVQQRDELDALRLAASRCSATVAESVERDKGAG